VNRATSQAQLASNARRAFTEYGFSNETINAILDAENVSESTLFDALNAKPEMIAKALSMVKP